MIARIARSQNRINSMRRSLRTLREFPPSPMKNVGQVRTFHCQAIWRKFKVPGRKRAGEIRTCSLLRRSKGIPVLLRIPRRMGGNLGALSDSKSMSKPNPIEEYASTT